jgi:hypothetical protein
MLQEADLQVSYHDFADNRTSVVARLAVAAANPHWASVKTSIPYRLTGCANRHQRVIRPGALTGCTSMQSSLIPGIREQSSADIQPTFLQ